MLIRCYPKIRGFGQCLCEKQIQSELLLKYLQRLLQTCTKVYFRRVSENSTRVSKLFLWLNFLNIQKHIVQQPYSVSKANSQLLILPSFLIINLFLQYNPQQIVYIKCIIVLLLTFWQHLVQISFYSWFIFCFNKFNKMKHFQNFGCFSKNDHNLGSVKDFARNALNHFQ